jgi:hypothetical protein
MGLGRRRLQFLVQGVKKFLNCVWHCGTRLFPLRIGNVANHVSQEDAPSFGLPVPLASEEADVYGAVEPTLGDPCAQHLNGAFVAERSGWD